MSGTAVVLHDAALDDAVLELEQATKVYPGATEVRALDGVDLVIGRGEMVAIVGPSGSGKSTLLNLIGALDKPTSGVVRIDGVDTSTLSDGELSARRAGSIGFVFQTFHLIEGQRAIDNVANGLLYRGLGGRQRTTAAAEALERVGLAGRAHHRPDQLSGGERQRVAIARALVGEPAIILADEPTGNLDTATGQEILELFRALHRGGHSIVLITHDNEIAAAAPRRVAIRDGRVEHDSGAPVLSGRAS
jgi:putative ABC transport system ATP-binding protein